MREPRLISDKRVLKCTALGFFCLPDWGRIEERDRPRYIDKQYNEAGLPPAEAIHSELKE